MDPTDDAEVPRYRGPDFSGTAAGVDGPLLHDALSDLAVSYAQYRRGLSVPFDPVMTLSRTGDVLRSVDAVLSAAGRAAP